MMFFLWSWFQAGGLYVSPISESSDGFENVAMD
jgi:hypothetical protein